MKKLIAVLLTAVLSMSVLTACGDEEAAAPAKEAVEAEAPAEEVVEEEVAEEAVEAASFEKVQEAFAILVDEYNQVKELYESDAIEANQEIEDVLNQAADLINEMGEISGDELTEEDCQELISTMVTIEEVFNKVLEAM